MATYRITGPDGGSYDVTAPDTASEAEVLAYAQQNYQPAPKAPEQGMIGSAMDFAKKDIGAIPGRIGDLAAGAVRGAGSIGATVLSPLDWLAKKAGVQNDFIGRDDRREQMDAGLQSLGADPESTQFQAGKLGTELAGTWGVGSLLGKGAQALPFAGPVKDAIVTALRTGGMKTGGALGPAADMAIRMGAGGTVGGTMAGMVDPQSAPVGAGIGAALPPVTKLAGAAGRGVSNLLSGPEVPQATQDAVQAARAAGLVIPPSQANPTLSNRMLEGFAGKLTTGQNASAKNAPTFNSLAKATIGADELSEAGIAQVRRKANAVYTELGNAGTLTTDDAYRQAIKQAGVQGEKFAADFPELVSKDADKLLEKFSGKTSFDAQSAIEAIKRLREGQRAGMKAFDDAEKKAYAKLQGKIANALEGVVERHLEKTGSTQLLTDFRKARETLAKAYDVEKALNGGSNIDASKLAAQLKKGKHLTGELRTIAEFAQKFPKASQPVERMGSLPQTSPLDWGAMGVSSAITGNPAMMAGVLARPAARSLVLSNAVQNRLIPGPGLLNLEPEALGLLTQGAYRAAPLLGSR